MKKSEKFRERKNQAAARREAAARAKASPYGGGTTFRLPGGFHLPVLPRLFSTFPAELLVLGAYAHDQGRGGRRG